MDYVTIGFSRPTAWFSPFSWLIRLVDGTPYSHTYISFYSDAYDRELIYQASSLKVNFMGRERFDSQEVIVKEFKIVATPETKKKLVQSAIDTVGTPYGILEVFGIGWVKLMARLGKTVKNPFRDGATTYVCLELVANILIDLFGAKMGKDPESMTPRDVEEYMEMAKENGQCL